METTVIDRSKPPVAGPPKDVRFPDYGETVLANGLKVIVYERHDLPIVTVSLVSRGGSWHDGDLPGRATMTAELLTKGTRHRSATRIVEDIEFLGGSIGAGATWDHANTGVTILSAHLEQALDVLADVVRFPTFPDEELDRIRQQRLAGILQRKSHPSSLASNRFHAAVFGSHPYGAPSEGTEDSITTLRREDVVDFHARFFQPADCFLIAVGDVRESDLLPLVERYLGDWESKPRDDSSLWASPSLSSTLVQVVDRPTAVQSSIIVGHAAIARNHPDFIPVMVMNTILGGYFGSRLNLNLREDKGYTYGAFSRVDARLQAGPWYASVEVRNDVTDLAIAEIIAEMQRLVREPVGSEELETVQRYITGNFPIQIETPLQVAQRMMNIELYGLGKGYYNTYNSTVLSLTADDIHRAANLCLHPDRVAIVASGRGALLRNSLARFGEVEVYDADGRLIPDVVSEREIS